MTTQKELHAKKRHRYMVQGPVGSGKSRTLVLLAKRYAQQGKRVLYIDYRDLGGVDELLKLDEKTLEHIDYTNPHERRDAYLCVEKRDTHLFKNVGARCIVPEVNKRR